MGVNILTKSPKFSDTTKLEFFELISFQSNHKISQKYWRADLNSLLVRSTCWPSISVLRRGFLGMEVTTHLRLYNFRKKSILRLIFFFKVFQTLCSFWKYRKNLGKIFFFWDKLIWIGCVKHSHLTRENTLNRVLICQQTVSRFQILLKCNFWAEHLSESSKKYDKNTAV